MKCQDSYLTHNEADKRIEGHSGDEAMWKGTPIIPVRFSGKPSCSLTRQWHMEDGPVSLTQYGGADGYLYQRRSDANGITWQRVGSHCSGIFRLRHLI